MADPVTAAIRAARERLGDPTIGAEPERGVPKQEARIRIVRIGEGRELIAMTGWFPREGLIHALEAL